MRKTCFRRVFSVFMVLSFMFTQSGGGLPGVGTGEVRALSEDAITSPSNWSVTNQYSVKVYYTVNGVSGQDTENLLVEGANVIVRGNASVSVYRDTQKPTINVTGTNPVNIAMGATYQDAGATADDSRDGDITGDIVRGGSVNTAVAGVYTVTYDVSDLAGNKADRKTRIVNVIDEKPADVTKPVITLYGPNPVSIILGGTYADEYGAGAEDDVDGNISDSIEVDMSAIDADTIGSYSVTYDVADAAGNHADQVNRTVNVIADETDNDSDNDEVLNEIDNCPLMANTDQANTDQDSMGDACDADDDNDSVSDDLDNCQFAANSSQEDEDSDGVGDACEDTEGPVITLSGVTPVTVFVGAVYADAGATATDNVDGDLTSKIDAAGEVIDTSVVGTHTVAYNVSDAAGNPALTVFRTVNVVEDDGEAADEDTDGDEIADAEDNCRLVANSGQEDADSDGIGDVCDEADDGEEDGDSGSGGGAGGSPIIGSSRSSVFLPTKFVPEGASVLINSGNAKTASRNVALTLVAPNAQMVAISNDSSFADATWELFLDGVEWTLSEGNGTKTVYVKFRNAAGTESDVYSDDIVLDVNATDAGGQVLGDNTTGIYDGDLIQCKNCADKNAVYVVKIVGNQRFIRQIKSDFFKFYSHASWSDVLQVSSLDGYIQSRWVRVNTGANGAAKPTDKVYEINGDWTKHWLEMTTEQFLARGGSEAAVFGINSGELGSYAAGASVIVS